MRTDRDFLGLCSLFVGAMVLGFAMFSCMATPRDQREAMRNVGTAVQETGAFLPPPFNYIADVAGLALVGFAGHKGVKHVVKRRAARIALKAMP